MTTVEEIIEYIALAPKSFNDILTKCDMDSYSLRETLIACEVKGLVVRRSKNKQEIWST